MNVLNYPPCLVTRIEYRRDSYQNVCRIFFVDGTSREVKILKASEFVKIESVYPRKKIVKIIQQVEMEEHTSVCPFLCTIL